MPRSLLLLHSDFCLFIRRTFPAMPPSAPGAGVGGASANTRLQTRSAFASSDYKSSENRIRQGRHRLNIARAAKGGWNIGLAMRCWRRSWKGEGGRLRDISQSCKFSHMNFSTPIHTCRWQILAARPCKRASIAFRKQLWTGIAPGTLVQGGVFKWKSYPLCQGVPFAKQSFHSYFTTYPNLD